MSKRYEELDSLRGLAALIVVIHHCLLTFTVFFAAYNHEFISSSIVRLLSNSPLHILWAGSESVILFFILSGFVLSLPFLNNKTTTYQSYFIKRVCRIYLPYIFTMILSILLFNLLEVDNPISSLSSWFNEMWSTPLTFKSALSYLLMLGFDTHNFNTVTWSLIHEMRISIFFPLVMIPIMKYDWKKSLVIGLLTTYSLWFVFVVASLVIKVDDLSFILKTIGDTFYYCSFFVIGAVFAKYKDSVKVFYNRQSTISKTLIVIFAILMYSIEWIVPGLGELKTSSGIYFIILRTFVNVCVTIAILILFMFALNAVKFQNKLKNAKLVYLGKISYSLYLIHPIVILASVYTLKGFLPIELIVVSVPFVSIIIASIMYKLIEEPSIGLGKKLIKKPQNKFEKSA
ncbi:acyltransferase family protein [Bacillus toyonensis]|nr:acyltransferase [Bacillus toyonensis]